MMWWVATSGYAEVWLSSLALGTRLASGLSRAHQKYVFVPYRELAYVRSIFSDILQAQKYWQETHLLDPLVKVPSVRSILYFYHLMSLVIVGLIIHVWLNRGLDWDTIHNKPVGDAFGTDVSWHDVSRCVPLARHVFRLRFAFRHNFQNTFSNTHLLVKTNTSFQIFLSSKNTKNESPRPITVP